jgi:hypothetical protein
MLSAIPFNLYGKNESYYHSLMLTLFWACGLNVFAEERTSQGMSSRQDVAVRSAHRMCEKRGADLVLNYHGDIYIIEFKKATARAALKQIKTKGYGKKYGAATLIGIEIDEKAKKFKKYLLEKADIASQ